MSTSDQTFADVLSANQEWAARTPHPKLAPVAAAGLAVLTCMDSRIDPLGMLGLKPGDAKILRNAGARVTDDVLRTTVLASYLLGVSRMMIVQHTTCAMADTTEEEVYAKIAANGGPDARSISFKTSANQEDAIRRDVQRIRSWPYLDKLEVGGFLLDLATGVVHPVC